MDRSLSSRCAVALPLLALCAFPPAEASATELELGLLAGAQQTGGIDTRDGDLDLEAGPLYGISFGWRVRPDGILEVALWRQESEATGELRHGSVRRDVEIDTIELGGLWETRPGAMRPFLGLQIGATRFEGLDPGDEAGWDPSGGISGGARWFFGEHAILRLEARLTGILFPDGAAVACVGPPVDCATSADGSLLGAFSARASLAARF